MRRQSTVGAQFPGTWKSMLGHVILLKILALDVVLWYMSSHKVVPFLGALSNNNTNKK